MPQVPNKMKMPIAITEHNRMIFNESHTTTSNFFELGIANIMEIVPGQSVNVSHRVFTRLEPMPVPTFGDCYIHNRAFFVPMRTIMPEFNSFITDSSVNSSTGLPVMVTSTALLPTDVVREYLYAHSTKASEFSFDFVYINSDQQPEFRKFTPTGARSLKLLQSLGYAPDFNVQNPIVNDSALPLLAVARIYLDWYYPSVYVTDYEASQVAVLLEQRTSTLGQPYVLRKGDIENIVLMIERVCYDADYFTSAWDNPVAPTTLTYSSVTINDVTDPNSPAALETDPNGTPRIKSTYNLTQYGDDALHALTDYMKRHQLSGARVLDRYLSRFGKTLDSAILDRCQYLGTHTQSVEFGNVTSTADTDGGNLGSYAGIGVGGGVGSFNYDNADEYGYFIILSSIVPKTGYYQGVDRMVMHTSKLDFFTPEFDNLGVQALATREVFVPLDSRQQYADGTELYNRPVDYEGLVFGFVPRYGEYKRGKDRLTGDYRLGSRNKGKDAWYLLRDMQPYFASQGVTNTKHGVDILKGSDASQYRRIFYSNLDIIDYFNIQHLFRIETMFPGKSLYDSYEFEDEDKAPKVSIDVNGVKAN